MALFHFFHMDQVWAWSEACGLIVLQAGCCECCFFWPKLFSPTASSVPAALLTQPWSCPSTFKLAGRWKTWRLETLGRAYLPNDARAKVFHGLGPGSSVTEAVLETVPKELDSYLVVDDYGSVECVKFARDEYNKRPVGDKWWCAKRRLTHASANRLYDHPSNYRIIHAYWFRYFGLVRTCFPMVCLELQVYSD